MFIYLYIYIYIVFSYMHAFILLCLYLFLAIHFFTYIFKQLFIYRPISVNKGILIFHLIFCCLSPLIKRFMKPSPDQGTLYRNSCVTVYLYCPDTVALRLSNVPKRLLLRLATVAKHEQFCLVTFA